MSANRDDLSPADQEALNARIALSDQRRAMIEAQEGRALIALDRHLREQALPWPRVSIVMPVYNGGRYFEDALRSALAQTYDDLEIVIVNDGSTDDGATDALARRYAAEHPDRIRYIHQENTGVSGALNTGVRTMTGDVFCWLSHDELFKPEKTAVQVEVWRRIGRRDAMLFSDYDVIGTEGEPVAAVSLAHDLYTAAPRLPIYRGDILGGAVFIPVHLLRERDAPFDPALRFAGACKLWFELLRERDFVHVPRSLVLSRRRPGQDSHRPDVADEGEPLWRGMIDALSEVQRAQLYGSSWRFFDETHKILAASPYQEVAAYAAERRDACIAETLVTVVLSADVAKGASTALVSVLAQTHTNLEVIVVDTRPTPAAGSLAELTAKAPRVRMMMGRGPDAAADLARAAREGRGAYIAYITAGAAWSPHKVAAQLEAMSKAGASISNTGFEPADPESPIALETIMLHRSLIAGGFTPPRARDAAAGWARATRRHAMLEVTESLSAFAPDLDGWTTVLDPSGRPL